MVVLFSFVKICGSLDDDYQKVLKTFSLENDFLLIDWEKKNSFARQQWQRDLFQLVGRFVHGLGPLRRTLEND